MHWYNAKKVALVNSTTHTLKINLGKETGQTEPGSVTFYDIRPGNRAGLFLQPRSPHHLCPHSGDSRRHFCSSDNCADNTNYCVVVLKCLALSAALILAN